MKSEYSSDFYREKAPVARRSAEVVVPIVVDLVQPKSVVDIGCATGEWLAAFSRHGIPDVVGVDGGELDPHTLQIPNERFLAADLEQPVELGRTFDLAMSVEVAEHLDARHAASFVSLLSGLAPVVLFSAAIPGQDGVGHVNNQWPEYWVRHFDERGFTVVDALRPKIWADSRVDWVYRQNCLLFVRRDRLSSYPLLERERRDVDPSTLALVHPDHYRLLVESRVCRHSPKQLASALPGALAGSLRRRLPDR